jgi:predicted O-methyltransferase YrrM
MGKGLVSSTVLSVGARNVARDTLRAVAFAGRLGKRSAARQRYYSCQSPEDYWRFASQEFPGGPSQKADEIVHFVRYLADYKPLNVAELGTSTGATNFIISQSVPTIKRMVGVDLFVQNRALLHGFRRPEQSLRYINGSSHDYRVRSMVEESLGGEALDFLFIDGDHTLEGVIDDFLAYRHFVRDGGLIAFHDIVPDNRLRGTGPTTTAWAGEVPLVWQRIKKFYDHREFVSDWSQEGYGIGVITFDRSVPADRSALIC